MQDGEMTPGRIIMFAITASIAINGIAWTFTNNALNEQSRSLQTLTNTIFEKMDDRYRRFEANAAHTALLDRIRAGEHRDDRMENEIKTHIIADDQIHQPMRQ
jgi:hypothetical protein